MNDVPKGIKLSMAPEKCVAGAHTDLIDSGTDRAVIETWFTLPKEGFEGCGKDEMRTMVEIMTKAKELAYIIRDGMAPNRIETIYSMKALQEASMWACACFRRSHAVGEILQKRRGAREVYDLLVEGERRDKERRDKERREKERRQRQRREEKKERRSRGG